MAVKRKLNPLRWSAPNSADLCAKQKGTGWVTPEFVYEALDSRSSSSVRPVVLCAEINAAARESGRSDIAQFMPSALAKHRTARATKGKLIETRGRWLSLVAWAWSLNFRPDGWNMADEPPTVKVEQVIRYRIAGKGNEFDTEAQARNWHNRTHTRDHFLNALLPEKDDCLMQDAQSLMDHLEVARPLTIRRLQLHLAALLEGKELDD